MSTRFIRKRYRRVVPIGRARLRESYLLHGPRRHHRLSNYPLYETANDIYNFQNIKESMQCWNEYSENLDSNIKNTATLLKLLGSHADSTEQDINEVTRIICEDVLPYIENPNKYIKQFENISESKLEKAKEKILDEIYILSECDRITYNFNTLNKNIDIVDFFIEDLKVRPLSESLYRFSDFISDIVPQYPDNFCITMEMALYSLDKIVDKVPLREVSEGIIDYYLVNGFNEDMNTFAASLDECLQKDEFLPNEINDYMLYIQKVMNKDQIYQEAVDEYFDNNVDMIMIEDIEDSKQIMRQRAYESLQEFQVFDRVKEIVTKFKTTPSKSLTTIKEAINAIFVTHRLQDIKKNTINALSLVFYALITLGFYSIGGALGLLLGFIVSLDLKHALNKEYYQESIAAWTQHKRSVERRLQNASGEEKTKLLAYLDEVEKNIKILTDKYESVRDDTSKEIKDRTDTEYNNTKHDSHEDLISPIGENPLEQKEAHQEEAIYLDEECVELLNEISINTLNKDNINSMIDNIKQKISKELKKSNATTIAVILLRVLEFCLAACLTIIWLPFITVVLLSAIPHILVSCVIFGLLVLCVNFDESYLQNATSALQKHMSHVKDRLITSEGKEKHVLEKYYKELKIGLEKLTSVSKKKS